MRKINIYQSERSVNPDVIGSRLYNLMWKKINGLCYINTLILLTKRRNYTIFWTRQPAVDQDCRLAPTLLLNGERELCPAVACYRFYQSINSRATLSVITTFDFYPFSLPSPEKEYVFRIILSFIWIDSIKWTADSETTYHW